jgi:hypothetical protein
MKSINQIFKSNKLLMDEPEVMELIEYCRELEDEVVENNQVIDQTIILKQLISEISKSCGDLLQEDEKSERWPDEFDKIDFKKAVKNLKKYISSYCVDNKIIL